MHVNVSSPARCMVQYIEWHLVGLRKESISRYGASTLSTTQNAGASPHIKGPGKVEKQQVTKVSRIGWTPGSFAFMISLYIFVATHVTRRGGGKLRAP